MALARRLAVLWLALVAAFSLGFATPNCVATGEMKALCGAAMGRGVVQCVQSFDVFGTVLSSLFRHNAA